MLSGRRDSNSTAAPSHLADEGGACTNDKATTGPSPTQQALKHASLLRAMEEIRTALSIRRYDAARTMFHEAVRLEPAHGPLIELGAWIELQSGHADKAVRLLEPAAARDDRLRLLLQLARCSAGQRAAAHLELCDWSRREECPPEARVLAAWLHLQMGDRADARQLLHRQIHQHPHAEACRMLLLMDLTEDLSQSAAHVMGVLEHHFGHRPLTGWWLTALGLWKHAPTSAAPLAMIERLAEELSAQPHIIPTLAMVQKLHPQPGRIELILRALRRVVDRLERSGPAIEAIAELSALAGDVDEARRWIRRGLARHPHSAKLALLLDRLADEELDPNELHPIPALYKVVRRHPQYADVRRALILNYHRRGLPVLARTYAEQWIERQPRHLLAERTYREVAA